MVLELCLAKGHVLELSLHNLHIFKSKRAICNCLPLGMYIPPHARMGPHMRWGIKEHDIHCEPKSLSLRF